MTAMKMVMASPSVLLEEGTEIRPVVRVSLQTLIMGTLLKKRAESGTPVVVWKPWHSFDASEFMQFLKFITV